MKYFKKSLLLLLLLVVGYCIWQRELVAYGFRQAKGQFTVLYDAKPVNEVLADVSFPDSLKTKIKLIQEIKRFAVDSLGLEPSKSYGTFYDQGGKPLIWTVTAAKPFQLEAKTWDFPIIGRFSYKGHFDLARTNAEADALKAAGFDTQVNEVSAWSTLGWLNDPILSSMLNRSEGQLAALIIHELTHGTLFTGTDLTFNENLADFVGDYGATRFLASKYGQKSKQVQRYELSKRYYDAYTMHIVAGAQQLDSLYKAIDKRPLAEKRQLKDALIKDIVVAADTLLGGQFKQPGRRFNADNLPNNAFFVGFLTYRSKQNQFQEEFNRKFAGDFPVYLKYLKGKYHSI